MRDSLGVWLLLQDPHFAVPGILLLASLSGIALVLFLQQKQLASNGHANGHLKGAAADGGTAFVEDETGLQVRRSKRERKSVSRFDPDKNTQALQTTPGRRSARAKRDM